MSTTSKAREYDPEVTALMEEAHRSYVKQITEEMNAQGLNTNRLTIGAKANAAMTYRMLKPTTNIQLTTMVRYARVLGKKLKLELVDIDD